MNKVRDLTVEEFISELPVDESGESPSTVASNSEADSYRSTVISAADLLAKKFPEPKYAVDGLLPEGLTVLVGQPKIGKSWLVLGIAIAVASGGKTLGTVPVTKGDALYLALEDGERRLQYRLKDVLNGGPIPQRLSFATEWRHIDEGGLEDIEVWLKAHPEARIVIIDTLQRVRSAEKGGGRLYVGDYEAVAPLGDLAKRYGVAVVVVHHTRKQDSDDPVDLVSGSTGLTGAADGVCVLRRARGQADAELFATGRDFEEKSLALKWDNDTRQWIIVGDAADFRISEQRREIKDVIRRLGGKAAPKAIADALGKKDGSVRKMLFDMKEDGQLTSDGNHNYYVGNIFGNAGNTSNGETDAPLFDDASDVTDVTPITAFANYNGKWTEDNVPF